METPLWQASYVGDARIVGALLADERLGVDLNYAGDDGRTPLYMAACNGHDTVVAALAEAGADLNKADNDKCTPLWIAASRGREGAVAVLLKAGADVRIKGFRGRTALEEARRMGHVGVIAQLEAHS